MSESIAQVVTSILGGPGSLPPVPREDDNYVAKAKQRGQQELDRLFSLRGLSDIELLLEGFRLSADALDVRGDELLQAFHEGKLPRPLPGCQVLATCG
jgi:hypothetical protein